LSRKQLVSLLPLAAVRAVAALPQQIAWPYNQFNGKGKERRKIPQRNGMGETLANHAVLLGQAPRVMIALGSLVLFESMIPGNIAYTVIGCVPCLTGRLLLV
jgi:hypothetical protein